MNARSIVSCFALFFVFVKANAQDASTLRSISTDDQLAVQKGEVNEFSQYIYRYNTAIEDADVESLKALDVIFIEKISEECSAKNVYDKKNQAQQKEILNELKKQVKSNSISHFIERKNTFEQFLGLMENELASMRGALDTDGKQ